MESRHKNNGSPTITPLSANGQIEHQEAIQQPKFLPNWDDAHMCNSPGDATHFLKRGKRKQNDKTSRTLRSWIVDNQIGMHRWIAPTHSCSRTEVNQDPQIRPLSQSPRPPRPHTSQLPPFSQTNILLLPALLPPSRYKSLPPRPRRLLLRRNMDCHLHRPASSSHDSPSHTRCWLSRTQEAKDTSQICRAGLAAPVLRCLLEHRDGKLESL